MDEVGLKVADARGDGGGILGVCEVMRIPTMVCALLAAAVTRMNKMWSPFL